MGRGRGRPAQGGHSMEPANLAAGPAGASHRDNTAPPAPAIDGRDGVGPARRGGGFAVRTISCARVCQAPRAASKAVASSTKPAASRPTVIARGGSGK